MRCRFQWGIYWRHRDGTRELMRTWWSDPLPCDARPPDEHGMCIEEITLA